MHSVLKSRNSDGNGRTLPMTEASGRDIVLRGLVLLGAAVGLLTEIFSLFHGLRRVPVLGARIIVLPAIAFISGRRKPPHGFDVRNQVMLQPLAEYFMRYTYVLSGGDHFVNLVQFLGFMGSVTGVLLVAQALALGRSVSTSVRTDRNCGSLTPSRMRSTSSTPSRIPL